MSKRLDSELWREIGARLKEIRNNRPTADFLMEHNLSPRIPWNSVEIGSRGFDVQTLIEICNAIDISLDWLLLGIGKENQSLLTDDATRANSPVRSKLLATEVIEDAIRQKREKHGAEIKSHGPRRKSRS